MNCSKRFEKLKNEKDRKRKSRVKRKLEKGKKLLKEYQEKEAQKELT